jgi:hypothetical protein
MGVALHSYKVDKDGEIRVRHTFYGDTVKECERLQEKHADGCESYGPALDDDRTIDFIEKDVELPDAERLRESDEIQGDG